MSYVSAKLELRTPSTNPVASLATIQKAETAESIKKYYSQRHRLFHLYDEGIILDEESWYSVTPEKIAAHIATRFEGKYVVMELFGGAGGNSIQFALAGAYVIAVEISEEKIAMAANNATVYGVSDYIEFIQADVYTFLPILAAQQQKHIIEGIFLSPPWGGPGYKDRQSFDVVVFAELVKLIKKVSGNIAILLPRNSDLESIRKYFGPCEVERNYLSTKLKTLTVYFGDLIDRSALERARAKLNDRAWTRLRPLEKGSISLASQK